MQITLPQNFIPSWYMKKVLQSPYRFQVLNWHRKARKTSLAVNKLVIEAFTHKAPYWYVGPSYGLAKKTIWDDPRMFPQYVPDWNTPNSKIIKKRETELRIDILPSGGQIYVFGADRPDLMRGPNPEGVILDEYAVMKPEVWYEIIQPVMRSNPNAWCWFLFTPRGRNHAYDAYQLGLKPGNEWRSWLLDVYHSEVFRPEQIEAAKAEMPKDTFDQELMCSFLEGEAAVFRNVRECMTAIPREPEINHSYAIGADLAKTQDRTVLAVYDRANNHQVYQATIKNLEWPYQKMRIASLSKHYNNALVILDATGLGDPIADDLSRATVPIEPIKFSQTIKKELIERLMLYIEQKTITMLPIEETLLEFDNFSYELGPTGNVRYGARDGYHDDIVISHALAAKALAPLVPSQEKADDPPLRRFRKFLFGQSRDVHNLLQSEWEGN